jgi:protein O-GlcNAc transferase
LGNVLQHLGRLDEAAASYRRALEINSDASMTSSNLLFCRSHVDALSAMELFAEHCRFGAQYEAPLRASWPLHRNTRDPGRCLQVGIVSGDLRDHAVAYFIEPLLAHLAGSPTLSLHAYYHHTVEDSVTKRLRGHFGHWHSVARLSDAALAQNIGADGIDILIDLSGHTGENRLLCFARKPAPVQASWMGYPGTTGLSAMDYYLADRYFLPPGRFESQFTEKLVYLPANAPFMPDKRAPSVNELPALSRGYMTFGSFNRIGKLSQSAIALWSRLLRAMPNARMLLGGMPREGEYDSLLGWFASEGIARERLSFHSRCSTADYLALHHRIDICLDTFPYTGGTTTSHALWMGVPTLTLAGHTAPGRQGAALMGHVGLEAFVAKDAADLQEKGLYWASNLAALAAVRAGLRQRCDQSPLRRPEVIAAGLESALRTMWQRWCAGLPAASIDASIPPTGHGLSNDQ